jgi:hypothetical protein
MNYELYINGKKADLSANTTFALSYQYTDLSNAFKYTDTFSKSVTLPLTNNNKSIFGIIDRIDRATPTSATTEEAERVFVDSANAWRILSLTGNNVIQEDTSYRDIYRNNDIETNRHHSDYFALRGVNSSFEIYFISPSQRKSPKNKRLRVSFILVGDVKYDKLNQNLIYSDAEKTNVNTSASTNYIVGFINIYNSRGTLVKSYNPTVQINEKGTYSKRTTWEIPVQSGFPSCTCSVGLIEKQNNTLFTGVPHFNILDGRIELLPDDSHGIGLNYDVTKESEFILYANRTEVMRGTVCVEDITSDGVGISLSGSLSYLAKACGDMTVADLYNEWSGGVQWLLNPFKEDLQASYKIDSTSSTITKIANRNTSASSTIGDFDKNVTAYAIYPTGRPTTCRDYQIPIINIKELFLRMFNIIGIDSVNSNVNYWNSDYYIMLDTLANVISNDARYSAVSQTSSFAVGCYGTNGTTIIRAVSKTKQQFISLPVGFYKTVTISVQISKTATTTGVYPQGSIVINTPGQTAVTINLTSTSVASVTYERVIITNSSKQTATFTLNNEGSVASSYSLLNTYNYTVIVTGEKLKTIADNDVYNLCGSNIKLKDLFFNYFKTARHRIYIDGSNDVKVATIESPSSYFAKAEIVDIPFTLQSFSYTSAKYKNIIFQTTQADSSIKEKTVAKSDYPFGSVKIEVGKNGSDLSYTVPLEVGVVGKIQVFNELYYSSTSQFWVTQELQNKDNKVKYNVGSVIELNGTKDVSRFALDSDNCYIQDCDYTSAYVPITKTVFGEPPLYFDDGTLSRNIRSNGTIYSRHWKNFINTCFNGSAKVIKGKAIITPLQWFKLQTVPLFFYYDNNLLFLNKVSDYDFNNWRSGTSVECILVNKTTDLI